MQKAILSFFSYTFLALAAENVIFYRCLGISNGLRVLNNPKKDLWYFCGSLTVFQLLNIILGYLVAPLLRSEKISQYARYASPAIFVIICTVGYLVVVTVLAVVMKKSDFKRIIYSLTGASINTAIVGTVLYSTSRGLDLPQTIGYALGSSIGFLLAMLLISEGEKEIHDDMVPHSFRGLPITLIYISIIALAIYGLTGHTTVL